MIKLNDLDKETINWYFKEIKDEVDKKLEECKSLFDGDFKISNNNEVLECFNDIQKNLKNFLIGNNLKKIIESYEEFLNMEVGFTFKIGITISLPIKDEELQSKYKDLAHLFSYEDVFGEFKLSKTKKKIKELNKRLRILKKIKKKNKEQSEKNKLKYKDFFMYIFDYNMLNEKDNGTTLRHILLSKMNTKTCPYCGRQYITNYNESYSTADLDHFYSQSKYPYLALNIHNFIPACAVCNRNFKNDKEVKINPRVEEFGENAVFTVGNDISTYMDMELEDIDLKLDIRTSDTFLAKRIEKNIDTFKLEEVYKIHNDYVLQMIKDITFRGNESYLESIKMLFEKDDENEVLKKLKKLIREPYEFRIRENEPLGKLTKDILNEIEKKLEIK